MLRLSAPAVAAFLLLAALAAAPVAAPAAAEVPDTNDGAAGAGETFLERLGQALERTEKSIKLAREQIVQSQTAPFLPQLYMQLAELLSQKSNTLYYIKMERDRGSSLADSSDKAFSPVIQAQQEAISIYRLLLREFPQFPKRMQVLLRLATALKSIDETGEFIKISSELLRQYPQAEDAVRVRLLLGQHYFDRRQDELALQLLTPVAASALPYERNLARYRIGLLYIAKDRFRDALHQFELVVSDAALKDQENPYEISLKKTKKAARADLKRDALIDSIRAYTHVHDKDADPVAYYSRLAPTELHFQEVIEKLSLRYINLKKYGVAVKLLRTLSERTADPQRVMAVYQEVLLMIPPGDRVSVPAEEIQFVFEKYNDWSSFYDIPKATQTLAYNFFEKQIREFGTTAHAFAKAEKAADRKTSYLTRARDFYKLYLGYFGTSPNAVKIATNLADVYYALGRYMESGDYYLRVFHGEFGAPRSAADKVQLVENAILCFEKKSSHSFFEKMRIRGLLIEAIEQYLRVKPARRNDARLSFAKLKAEYEQGFFPEVLEAAFDYMRRFRKAPQAVDAGELILDYFNTRSEFAGLENWSNRMLGLKLPQPAFNRKLASIRQSARSRVLTEKVQSLDSYDAFSQGKSYLAAALSLDDQKLAGEALRQALARSKAERDIATFLSAASAMAASEKDRRKRSLIMKSVARESARVTRFEGAIQSYEELARDMELPPGDRREALEEQLNLALLMRDWQTVLALLQRPGARELSGTIRGRARDQLSDVLASPLAVPAELPETLLRLGLTDDTFLALYKAQHKLPSALQARVVADAGARCGRQSRQPYCRWVNLQRTEAALHQFNNRLAGAPRSLQGIETMAQHFAVASADLQTLEGSGDPLLETTLSMMSANLYLAFGRYLRESADRNSELRQVLLQKSEETNASAKLYQERCRAIGGRDLMLRPRTELCRPGDAPTVRNALSTRTLSAARPPAGDPSDREIEDLRRVLFAEKDDSAQLLQLALRYLKEKAHHHAVGTASLGMSRFKAAAPQFRAILACGLIELGLTGEASYHLRGAADVPSSPGLKDGCARRLVQIAGDL